MSAFREQVAADISNVFINADEFAEEHDIDGRPYICVVESPTDRETFLQGIRSYDGYDGIHGKMCIVHIKKDDLDEPPPEGQPLKLDGEIYTVNQIIDDMGMLSIVLHGEMRG